MSDLSQSNPMARFTGLASGYAKHRPSYPSEAIDFVIQKCSLGPSSLLVDIGSGTGISSRLFAERGVPVIGIEPNAEMRAKAEKESLALDAARVDYRDGTAETTGLSESIADAVLAAQAFHWFKVEPALQECRRILKRTGWAVLMWNERDENDPFTKAYGDVIRTAPETAAVEGPRGRAGEVLLTHRLFRDAELVEFPNQQALDEEGVLGRAFSASYAPREQAAAATFANALRRVFADFQEASRVVLRYTTSIYLARPRKEPGDSNADPT
jgi:SAM-dependent methyltransferase